MVSKYIKRCFTGLGGLDTGADRALANEDVCCSPGMDVPLGGPPWSLHEKPCCHSRGDGNPAYRQLSATQWAGFPTPSL